ncbi:hypothetical protein [Desulfotignum balticum]|uniref:hypothetical protein n=1 Tax=Desulfotignum balticum TaxID=115781 RepID=UPI0003FEC2C5|nr:hypothetical protein [Desulfotignum balticum]
MDTSGEALEKACKEGVYMIKPNIGEFRKLAAGTAAVMTTGTQLCRKEDTQRLFETMISES